MTTPLPPSPEAAPAEPAIAEIERLYGALENCWLYAARHRKEEWAAPILRFAREAGLGSPLRENSPAPREAARDTNAALREWLDGQEFHERCMDYRGASIKHAPAAFALLKGAILAALAAAQEPARETELLRHVQAIIDAPAEAFMDIDPLLIEEVRQHVAATRPAPAAPAEREPSAAVQRVFASLPAVAPDEPLAATPTREAGSVREAEPAGSGDARSVPVLTKAGGAYGGSKWRVVSRFKYHVGGIDIDHAVERVVAESVAIPGLLHIFAPDQLVSAASNTKGST